MTIYEWAFLIVACSTFVGGIVMAVIGLID